MDTTYVVTVVCLVRADSEDEACNLAEDALNRSRHVIEIDSSEAEEE